MNNLTDVVKKLLILNVAVYFAATMLLPDLIPDLAMKSPLLFGDSTGVSINPNFKPFTMVTHMFMHDRSGLNHLLFNMMGLFFFGPYVERALGEKRFVILYFFAGFLSMITHFGVEYFLNGTGYIPGIVGASGAISGVLFAFILMFPDVKVMLLIPPIPMKAKYMAIVFFGIDFVRRLMGANIAVFGHLGGAIAGIILILLWRKSNFKL